jgi:phage terminase large subunit-like protein
MKPMIDTDTTHCCVGGRGGRDQRAGARACRVAPSSKISSACTTFARVRERADADELNGFISSLGVKIVRARREDQWASGYCSLLSEDPDARGRVQALIIPLCGKCA